MKYAMLFFAINSQRDGLCEEKGCLYHTTLKYDNKEHKILLTIMNIQCCEKIFAHS